MAWLPTYGTGRQALGIGTGMCCLKVSNMVRQDMSLLWASQWHVTVTGDNAYAVVAASMTFRVQGKQVTQTGAILTVALRKLGAGWRIAAWAWTKGGQ